MTDYSKMTTEDFDRLLATIMNENAASELLSIPGVYEVVSEHFNNSILETWDEEQAVDQHKNCIHTFEANHGLYDSSHRYCTKCGMAE